MRTAENRAKNSMSHRGTDSQPAETPDGAPGSGHQCQEPGGRDLDHVLRGDDIQNVENEPVLSEDHNVNVFAADLLHGTAKGGECQHRGALFGKFDKKDAAGLVLACLLQPTPDPKSSNPCKRKADRRPHKTIHQTHR